MRSKRSKLDAPKNPLKANVVDLEAERARRSPRGALMRMLTEARRHAERSRGSEDSDVRRVAKLLLEELDRDPPAQSDEIRIAKLQLAQVRLYLDELELSIGRRFVTREIQRIVNLVRTKDPKAATDLLVKTLQARASFVAAASRTEDATDVMTAAVEDTLEELTRHLGAPNDVNTARVALRNVFSARVGKPRKGGASLGEGGRGKAISTVAELFGIKATTHGANMNRRGRR